jgi:hypothetical protein
MTNELIERIQIAAIDLAETNSAVDVKEDQIRMNSLNRMRKSLALALAVIKGVGTHIYNQWHPSPNVPVMDDHFDPTDEGQLENYMKQVSDFLNGLVSNLDLTSKAADQKNGNAYKLGKGVEKIALHLAPFVKLLVKLGKQDGLVFHPGFNQAQILDPRSLRSGLQWVGSIVSSSSKRLLVVTV